MPRVLDHVGFEVSDLARSAAFYDALFHPLGGRRIFESPDAIGYGIADAPAVVRRLFPDYEPAFERRGWSMFQSVERVYVNARARSELGWDPRYDFRAALDRLEAYTVR